MAMSLERARRWTRAEYDRLIRLGVSTRAADGHLIVAEPQGTLHATAVGLVEDAPRSPGAAGGGRGVFTGR
jgi:hypothetical protein